MVKMQIVEFNNWSSIDHRLLAIGYRLSTIECQAIDESIPICGNETKIDWTMLYLFFNEGSIPWRRPEETRWKKSGRCQVESNGMESVKQSDRTENEIIKIATCKGEWITGKNDEQCFPFLRLFDLRKEIRGMIDRTIGAKLLTK